VTAPKKEYLAVYDYGMGGLWIVIDACSTAEIATKYPVLEVFDGRPNWMTVEELAKISSKSHIDIADDPPEWLRIANAEAKKSS
jgi:hypothetical protein